MYVALSSQQNQELFPELVGGGVFSLLSSLLFFPLPCKVAVFSQFWLSRPNVLLASKRQLGPDSLVAVQKTCYPLPIICPSPPAGYEPMGRPGLVGQSWSFEGVDSDFAEQSGSVVPDLQTAVLFLPLPRKHVL